MEYENGNKLIAEFMGATMNQDSYYQPSPEPYTEGLKFDNVDSPTGSRNWVDLNDLKYHTSWDWLIPVVEKIEKGARVDIYGCACKISQPQWTLDIAHINESKLTATWICVVEFIQYVNYINSKPPNP